MSRLRTTLGVLLVMIGLVSASHPILVGDLLANLAAAGQADDSDDDSSSDAAPNCVCFTLQSRLTAPAPIRKLDTSAPPLATQAPPQISAVQICSRPSSVLIPTSACLAKTGLLPRAPALV